MSAATEHRPVDPDIGWRYPVRDPDRWCYVCWYSHTADDGVDCAILSLPDSPEYAVNAAAMHAARALGVPLLDEGPWELAHVEAARALMANLQMRIDIAERRLARR